MLYCGMCVKVGKESEKQKNKIKEDVEADLAW